MARGPRYVEIDGVLYERVGASRPDLVHFLPLWRQEVHPRIERYKTACGLYVGGGDPLHGGPTQSAGEGTAEKKKVTCARCCRSIGTAPPAYPQAKLVEVETGVPDWQELDDGA